MTEAPKNIRKPLVIIGVIISIAATVLALYLLLTIVRSYAGLVEPTAGPQITPRTAILGMVAYWIVTPFAIFFGFFGAISDRLFARVTFLIITIVLFVSGYLSARLITPYESTGGSALLIITEILLASVPGVGVLLAIRQFWTLETKSPHESKQKVD